MKTQLLPLLLGCATLFTSGISSAATSPSQSQAHGFISQGTSQSTAQELFPAHAFYAKDLAMGLSYRMSPNWEARAEVHKMQGTAFLTYEDNPAPQATQKDWTLGLFQLNYTF
jgi:hypothetical protein